MNATSKAKIAQLAHALDAQEWSKAQRLIHKIPTTLPKNASPRQLASTVDFVRAAADTIREACDFSKTFEAAYVTRRALLRHDVVKWAVSALDGFVYFTQVIAKLAAVLGLLGIGSEGRCIIGATGAVDKLTILWQSHPSCLEIVSALLSLCSGHIDNVSRFMRRRGITIAVRVLRDSEHRCNSKLVQQTLVLVGFCAVCTPDNEEESVALQPAILECLENCLEDHDLEVAAHSLIALANIGDCWSKESLGYKLDNVQRMVASIIGVWDQHATSRRLGAAASWALSALSSGHPSVKPVLERHSQQILTLCSECPHVGSALQHLQQMLRTDGDLPILASASDTDPDCQESSQVHSELDADLSASPPVPPRRAYVPGIAEKQVAKKRRTQQRRRLWPPSHIGASGSPVRVIDMTAECALARRRR